ncbi:MAG: radical SAM/SPASM domain-containing protein [candidate division KSB1 bacterium]|nr:radical SAM/SPASM domain-containing protein [candidate division KSB1 bacterium]
MCNLRCPLCVSGSGRIRRPRGMMSLENYKTFIKAVADRVVYITLYHQGEPYLHPKINEMVAFAKSYNLYVSTSTNAHFFDSSLKAKAVVNSGLDSMILSLDGVNPESYAHYRRGGDLHKVIDGIQQLIAAKKQLNSKTPYLFLQFLVMKHNEKELGDIKELAKKLRVDRLLIKTVQVNSYEEAQEWLPADETYRRYDLGKEKFIVMRGKGACPRLWMTTLIDWDGTIVPCCFDKNAEYAMGCFTDAGIFNQVWTSESYQRFRQQVLKNRDAISLCRNCNYGIGLFK